MLLVRIAITTYIVHNNNSNTNSKERWNILTTITVTKGVIPVEFLVFDECTDKLLSSQFVHHLVKETTLQQGDIFIVNNYIIHIHGES